MKIVYQFIFLVSLLFAYVASAEEKIEGWGSEPVGADGGTPDEGMTCIIANKLYVAHLTTYQDDPNADGGEKFKPYCQDLPVVGKTFLTLDLSDRHSVKQVRTQPISVAVIEEKASEQDPRKRDFVRTITEVPAKVYKQGVLEVQADFDMPGNYALLLKVGHSPNDEDTIRIPLRVAQEASGSALQQIIPIVLLAGILLGGLYFWKNGKISV